MQPTQLAATAIQGRAIGAMVLAGFAALWLGLGVWFVGRARIVGWGVAAIGTVGVFVVALQRLHAASAFRRSVQTSAPTLLSVTIPASYFVIVALEIVLIMFARWLCRRRGRPDLILPAIAIIVAVHFIPLAPNLHYSGFYLTGAAMLAATLALLATPPSRRRLGFICLATGVALWVTAAALVTSTSALTVG